MFLAATDSNTLIEHVTRTNLLCYYKYHAVLKYLQDILEKMYRSIGVQV